VTLALMLGLPFALSRVMQCGLPAVTPARCVCLRSSQAQIKLVLPHVLVSFSGPPPGATIVVPHGQRGLPLIPPAACGVMHTDGRSAAHARVVGRPCCGSAIAAAALFFLTTAHALCACGHLLCSPSGLYACGPEARLTATTPFVSEAEGLNAASSTEREAQRRVRGENEISTQFSRLNPGS
jgi:hypothetical protein